MRTKAVIGCSAALWAISLALAAPASAQTASEANTTSASGENGNGEILVTARRREERLQDVPVAASVVNQEQIRQYDLTSVSNIRIAAPEISLDRGFTGSGSSIVLRGVSSSSIDGGIEQSVLVDFDGMAISRGRLINDALFDVGGLTVLKGPQAVFFGKNSPGGVISIKSNEPTDSFTGYIRAGYEFAAHTKQVETALSGPITGGLKGRLAFFFSDSDGFLRNNDVNGVVDRVRTAASGSTFVPAGPAYPGAERRIAGRATLAYDNGSPFTANLKVLGSWTKSNGLSNLTEVMGCPGGRTSPATTGGVIDPVGDCKIDGRNSPGGLSQAILDSWPQVRGFPGGGKPYGRNNTFMPVLTLNYKADTFNLTSVTGYYYYDFVNIGNADATSYSYFYSYSNEENKSFYQELRATTSLDGIINFAVGGHYEHNNRVLYVGAASGPAFDATTGRYNFNDNEQRNKSEAYSAFGQVVLKPIPQIEIAGGGRYTHQTNQLDSFNTYLQPGITSQIPAGKHIIGNKSQNNFSPEATLTWRPSNQVTLYGAYKTGFLAGGFSNPGSLAATATADSLSFSAEKVHGFEVGLKTSLLNRRLSANLTGYRYTYEGLPLTTLLVLNATTQFYTTQNAANTVAQGIEFEGNFRAGEGITLRGTASYNDAKYQSFPKAQCYTGQTLAQGCVTTAAPAYQDLSNRPVYRAPQWILTAGVTKDTEISDAVSLNTTFDVRTTSGYYAGVNLNPLSYQKGFLTVNAGATLTIDKSWSIAVIGRNLTNQRYATLALDKPGGSGEVSAVAGEPRAVVLQAGVKF